MQSVTTTKLIGSLVFVSALVSATQAHAQIPIGNWQRTDAQGAGLSMTVEPCCSGGLRLTYHIPTMGNQPPITMTVDSPMNGTDVPALIGGKPSGETMAITRLDDHHYRGIVKMDGKTSGTSNATVSADGKSMTVETVSQSGSTSQKIIETWVRK